MAKRKLRASTATPFGDPSWPRCPREGLRVCLRTAHGGMYTQRNDPKSGDCGEAVSLSVRGRRATCVPFPGDMGALVYVRWDSGHVAGVFKGHLVSEGGKALAGGKRRRKARR